MNDAESMSADPRFGASNSDETAAVETAETDTTETETAASERTSTDQSSAEALPGDERAEAVQLRVELDDVEAALERLDDGTYGTCQVCGTAFSDEDLQRHPQARLCVEHSS